MSYTITHGDFTEIIEDAELERALREADATPGPGGGVTFRVLDEEWDIERKIRTIKRAEISAG